jgi:hypothetical protein
MMWGRHARALRIVAAAGLLAGGTAVLVNRASAQTRAAEPAKATTPWRAEVKRVPKPLPVVANTITQLVEFEMAPFPYEGVVPATGKPFLDVTEEERRGHKGMRGQTFWEDETYNDKRVLLHLPKGFDPRRPALMVVFFHGHGATLERDVIERQQVVAQIARSGLNAVLVAPQFARDAADSSAGKLWKAGAMAKFLDEAARKLTALHGDPATVRVFSRMPVVFVAYSGGYVPAAYALHGGGITKRVRSVLLLDALYGEIDRFSDWLTSDRSGVFVSAYTHLTAERNKTLKGILTKREIPFTTELTKTLRPGSIVFVATDEDTKHRDYVTQAWTEQPITDFLARQSKDFAMRR